MQELKPSPPVLEYQSPVKVWRVGTLTYTAGGLVLLFCWLLSGDFVWRLKEVSIPPALQLLLKQFKASDLLNGFLIGMLPNALAMVIQPIVSFRSDRHRGRWGRRIPFLLIPTPIAALSMAGLAFAPGMGRWMSELTGAGVMSESTAILFNLAVFWTLFELSSIVANSVFFALINDVVPPELLGRFFALFRIIGLTASMTFSYFLLGKVETHYVPIFLGLGLLYGIGFGAMCFFVKEGSYPDPEVIDNLADPKAQSSEKVLNYAKPAHQPHGFWRNTGTYFRECFSNPYYIWYFVAIMFVNMAFHPIGLFYIYLAKSLGMTADELGKTVSTPQLGLSFLLAFPVGWLCDKFHPIRITLITTGMYAAAAMLAFVYIHDARSFTIAQICCGGIAGAWSTAYNPLSPRLLPKPLFASFFSALSIVANLAVMVTSLIVGAALDALHHEYRYIYLWASVFAGLSFIALWVVYQKFKGFGGVKNYVAPL